MSCLQILLDLRHDVGMFVGDVLLFAKISSEVVEFHWLVSAELHGLPVARARGLLEAALVKFPIKELVLIGLWQAEQCGDNGNAIDAGRWLYAGQLRRRRQEIPERPHLV